MIGGNEDYWEPHEFYQRALTADRELREQSLAVHQRNVNMSQAIAASELSRTYPNASNGLLATLAMSGMMPNSPYAALFATMDMQDTADSLNGGLGPEGEAARATRARSSAEVAAGNLPGLVRPPSLLARLFNVPKSAVRGLFMASAALYEETLSKVAFAAAAHRQGLDPVAAWDDAPESVLRMAISEMRAGNRVNLGSNWFTVEGDLAPLTQRRLEQGMPFDEAIQNAEQMELGVPLGHLWNHEQSAMQVYYRDGETTAPTPGSLISSSIFDANNWAARATAGVIDFAAMTLTDPGLIVGGVTGAGRAAATRLLPSGTRGMGMTMTEYLATPSARRAIRALSSLQDEPVQIARAIRRAVPHGDRATVADTIAQLAGDEDTLLRYLQTLNSKGVMTNTFEPISLSGYVARRAAIRNPNSATGRFAGKILDAAAGSRIAMPALGAQLATLGMRGPARRATVRSMGAIGGFGAAVSGRIMYTPRMHRLIGGVARVLSTTDGNAATTLDNYGRSMMLTLEQRNEIFKRAARQPELRQNDAFARATDAFLRDEYRAGNPLVAREYGAMLDGVGGEGPLNIVADAHRYFTENMSMAAGLAPDDAAHLSRLMSRVFDGVQETRLYMLDLAGNPMHHPLARTFVTQPGGRRMTAPSAMDLAEAMATNIPLLDPRGVRMLLRRAGQMGIGGPQGHRLGILAGMRGSRAERLIDYARYLRGSVDEVQAPLLRAIENSDARRVILEANSIDDLVDKRIGNQPALQWIEESGLRVDQWDDLKTSARTYADALDEVEAKGFFEASIDDADNMVFRDATGRTVSEALADASAAPIKGDGLIAAMGKPYNAQEALIRAMSSMQASVWKPLVMLRPAYIFRVVGEEQMRMWFAGYRSIFNSPISMVVLAMASRNPNKTRAWTRWLSDRVPNRAYEKGKRLQQILGVPDEDMARELLGNLREFNDAMYRGRQNAFIRGDVQSYVGRYREVDFSIVDGRLSPDTAEALASELLSVADSPAKRTAASAMYLDLLDDPDEVRRLLDNDPDFELIADAYRHYGSTTTSVVPNGSFKEGFSGLYVRAYADRHGPDGFVRLRGSAERLNHRAQEVMGANSEAAAHAQAHLAALMDTQGIRYVRRDINGRGLITNADELAEDVLDEDTLRFMMRQAASTPNEDWYKRIDVEIDGPVRLIPDERVRASDLAPDSESLLAGSAPGQRLIAHPQPMGDGRVGLTVIASDDYGNLQGRVTLAIDHTGGRQRITAIDSLEMTFGSEVKIGSMIETAMNRVDPGWLEGATAADLLDFPVNGKPLRDWFADSQIQTSSVGLADWMGNPNFERMTVNELLEADVPGEYTPLAKWLYQKNQRGRLPDDIVDKLDTYLNGNEVTQIEPGVFTTPMGTYRVVGPDAEPMFVVPDAGQGSLATTPPPTTPIPPAEVAVETTEWSARRVERVARNADTIRGESAMGELRARYRTDAEGRPVAAAAVEADPDGEALFREVVEAPPAAAVDEAATATPDVPEAPAATPEVPVVDEGAPLVTQPRVGITDEGRFDLTVDDDRLMAAFERGVVGGQYTGDPVQITRLGAHQAQILDDLFLSGDSVQARAAVRRFVPKKKNTGRARGSDARTTRDSFEIMDVDYVRETLEAELEGATTRVARERYESMLKKLDAGIEAVGTPSRRVGFAEQVDPRTLPRDFDSGLRIYNEIPAAQMTADDVARWKRRESRQSLAEIEAAEGRDLASRTIEERFWPGSDRIKTTVDEDTVLALQHLLGVDEVPSGLWKMPGFSVRSVRRNVYELTVTDDAAFRQTFDTIFDDYAQRTGQLFDESLLSEVDAAVNASRKLAYRDTVELSWTQRKPQKLTAKDEKAIKKMAEDGSLRFGKNNRARQQEAEMYSEWVDIQSRINELNDDIAALRGVGRDMDGRLDEIVDRQGQLTLAAQERADEMMATTPMGRKLTARYDDAVERQNAALAEIEAAGADGGADAARVIRNAKKRAATAQRTMDEVDAVRRDLIVNGPETAELTDLDIEQLLISHREGKSPGLIAMENEIAALELQAEQLRARGFTGSVEQRMMAEFARVVPEAERTGRYTLKSAAILSSLVDYWRNPAQTSATGRIRSMADELVRMLDDAAHPPRTTYLDLGAAPGDIVGAPGYQVVASNGEVTRVVESFTGRQYDQAVDTMEIYRKLSADKGESIEYTIRRIQPEEAEGMRQFAEAINEPEIPYGDLGVDPWATEIEMVEAMQENLRELYRNRRITQAQYREERAALADQLDAARAEEEAGLSDGFWRYHAPENQGAGAVDNLGDDAMGMGDEAYRAPVPDPEPAVVDDVPIEPAAVDTTVDLGDLPDETAFDPDAATPVGVPEPDEAIPSAGSHVTVSYGDDAIVVKDGEITSQLFTNRREARVSEALARRLLAEADAMDLDLTIVTKDADMWPRYEAIGFDVYDIADDGTITMNRGAGTPIPDEWPAPPPIRQVTGPTPAGDEDVVRIIDQWGEVLGDVPAGRAEATIRDHVDSMASPAELTKEDLKNAYRVLHESDPAVYSRPGDILRAIDNSGEAMIREVKTPRPGFTSDGQQLPAPPDGTPRAYWDTEMGPTAYMPLPDQPWDTGMIEAITRNRALGRNTLDDYVQQAVDDGVLTMDDVVGRNIEELQEIVAPDTTFDPATGREVIVDFDQVRSEMMTDSGQRSARNRIGAAMPRFTNVMDWNPTVTGGIGKKKLRAPVLESDAQSMGAKVTGWLFDVITARPSNMLARGPVWADAYTEAIADLYGFATPEVRGHVIDYFRDVGLHGGNHELTNLAAALIGRRDFKNMAVEQMEEMLLSQSKVGKAGRVGGKSISRMKIDPDVNLDAPIAGIDDWEQFNLMAQQIANERVKALLFDASERAQIFDQMALIFPFGDAFVELITRWWTALATSPYRTRNITRLGRTLRAVNGGMYEDGGMFSDDAGLSYSDPISGEQMLMFPWSRSMSSLVTGDDQALRQGLNMQGLSPITTALVPGIGPMVSMPASVLPWQNFLRHASVAPRDSLERILYEQIFPFGMYDIDLERGGLTGALRQLGMPAWAERMAAAFANAWSEQNEAIFGNDQHRSTMNNMAMELVRSGAASGRYDLSTPQMQEAALDDAMRKTAGIEMLRAMGLFLAGGNAANVRIPHLRDATPQELASLTDRQIDGLMTYLAPVAYNREYQRIVEENGGDYVAAAIQFDREFGFDPSYVRVSRSVELKPSSVTSEGRIFQMANKEMFRKYDLAAYYLQPDPPAADFDYGAFRHGMSSSSRHQLSPQDYVFALNNSIGMHEYAQAQRRLNAMYDTGQITRMDADTQLRLKRIELREKFPGYDRSPGASRPDPRDIADQIHTMVVQEGDGLQRYQMGKLIREADTLIQQARLLSLDTGHGEWYWATSPSEEAAMIRMSVRGWFEQKARLDPRVAILWNEVYGRILPSGDVARGSILTDDPFFSGFIEDDGGYEEWLEEAG